MILLAHNNNKVVNVKDLTTNVLISVSEINPVSALFLLSKKFPDSILIWCHINQKDNINLQYIKDEFNLKNMMLSYSQEQYLPSQIGYIDASPFHKINKKVRYPTWLMNSEIGAIHASILIKFKDIVSAKNGFDYALNSIAKLGMEKGLFCYSAPELLLNLRSKQLSNTASISRFFKFVKQHYKTRWILLLLVNFIWHDKKFPFIAAFKSYFYKRVNANIVFELDSLIEITKEKDASVDVLIPTIGRKKYLYDVLIDLKHQTLLPKHVIIIEQNSDTSSKSALKFIEDDKWPFKIVHKFIHQTGACNARNIGLQHVSSNYIFFADDDIRFNENTLEDTVDFMATNQINVTTLSCLRPNDEVVFNEVIQWTSFGSGCSIVKKEALKGIKFNMAFEHGFGEDSDFGIQLRNKGEDIIYLPKVKLTHLKAPIGGFRFKHSFPWENEIIQPKPSPTILLYWIFSNTKYQFLGYKTILFFKFYKDQKLKNPFTYYKKFKKQWKQSVYWANKLKKDNS